MRRLITFSCYLLNTKLQLISLAYRIFKKILSVNLFWELWSCRQSIFRLQTSSSLPDWKSPRLTSQSTELYFLMSFTARTFKSVHVLRFLFNLKFGSCANFPSSAKRSAHIHPSSSTESGREDKIIHINHRRITHKV